MPEDVAAQGDDSSGGADGASVDGEALVQAQDHLREKNENEKERERERERETDER